MILRKIPILLPFSRIGGSLPWSALIRGSRLRGRIHVSLKKSAQRLNATFPCATLTPFARMRKTLPMKRKNRIAAKTSGRAHPLLANEWGFNIRVRNWKSSLGKLGPGTWRRGSRIVHFRQLFEGALRKALCLNTLWEDNHKAGKTHGLGRAGGSASPFLLSLARRGAYPRRIAGPETPHPLTA